MRTHLAFIVLTGLAYAADQVTNGKGEVVDVDTERIYQNLVGNGPPPDTNDADPEAAKRARMAKNLKGDLRCAAQQYSPWPECDNAYGRLMLGPCNGTCERNGRMRNQNPCSSGDLYDMMHECFCVPMCGPHTC